MPKRKKAPATRDSQAVRSPRQPQDIAHRILRYFHRNRDAMDSIEGISRFWVHEDRGAVERSVADLHRRGLLQERIIAGTVFYSLPRAGAHRHISKGRVATAAAAPSPKVCGRILVADDDPAVRQLLMEALKEAGHSVAVAEDGKHAIMKIRTEAYDLVVTDVLMPKISGIEVLEAVKRDCPATQVIVVTGHATLDNTIQALRKGAYDFLTKPIGDLELLYRMVERALEKTRLEIDNRLLVENLQRRNLELKETVARLAAINEIGKTITGVFDLNELYDALVQMVAHHLQARRVSVLISEPDHDTMTLVASLGIADPEVVDSQMRIGESIAGRVAASQAPLLVEDIDQTELKGLGSGTGYRTSSFMSVPLMMANRYRQKPLGVINVSDKHSGDPFKEQDLEFLSTLSSQIAIAIEHARLVKDMDEGYLTALVALIQAVEDSRPETFAHSQRVASMVAALGRATGLSRPRLELLQRAALLHEVGRLSARSQHRRKGSPGSFEEWTPAAVFAAEKILAPIATLGEVREILLHSTDAFEAAPSLPGAVRRPSIPVESRILAICEEFVCRLGGTGNDAERRRKALGAIRGQAGRKHDPEVVAALCDLLEGGDPAVRNSRGDGLR